MESPSFLSRFDKYPEPLTEEVPVQVLFIGNSFTYFNDMPYTFLNMIKTVSPDARVESLAYGGYSLAQYADEDTEVGRLAISKIVSYEWDYVVLQEQSLLPCREPEAFLEAVKKLCGIISQINAKVILFQTWAYEEGSDKLADTGMTYEEMTDRLTEAYRAAAEATGATVAPIGELFSYVAKSDHITHLINRNDHYHPSTSGSYLAACVIFKLITGGSTIGLPSPANVSLYNLSVVQKVSDSLKV
ncbi:MAG: DUF4886 domain-containing protein [Ruminococcaceae bacterium]|nr:DUF4886 domain-containing protein [Oscillospiraceae bacterium]